jgi:transporter family-2 protein
VSSGVTSFLIVAVGAQLALQAPINSALGEHVGRLAASLVSFVVGTSILVALIVFTGGAGSLPQPGDVPAYQMLGGLIGAAYVATGTFTVARIGAGAVVAATVTGQLLSSLLIDDLGLVGVDEINLDAGRVLGAVLLLVGTVLVVARRAVPEEEDTKPNLPRKAALRGLGTGDLPFVGIVFGAGLLVGLQHPLNSLLAESTGDLAAGLTNFLVGTVLLAVLVLATGRASKLIGAREAPPWQFIGGLFGVVTVVAALAAVSTIGAAGLTAALVTGQVIGSIAVDRAGAFGLDVRLLTFRRIGGTALLLVGTALCVV